MSTLLGGKKITQKAIADRLGIHNTTVSMALRDNPLISQEVRDRVKKLAQELGYRPSMVAKALRMQKTHTIGIIMSDAVVPIVGQKMMAIEQVLARENYEGLVSFNRAGCKHLIELVQNMQCRQVDGLILGRQYPDNDLPEFLNYLESTNIPTILADCAFTSGRFPEISVDRASGTERLVQYLHGIGHRDFLFICYDPISEAAKLQGFVQGSLAVDQDHTNRLRVSLLDKPGSYRPEEIARLPWPTDASGKQTADSIEGNAYRKALEVADWRDRPSVVLLPNDFSAMMFVRGLLDKGMSVPGDISVTGFDNTIDSRICRPRLTTMHQPKEQMAETAAQMLLHLMKGQELAQPHICLIPELIVRDSTGPVPAKRVG